MTGILKVDTIQKNDGTVPTAADLGLKDASNTIIGCYQAATTAAFSTSSTTTRTDVFTPIVFTPKAGSKVILISNLATMKFGDSAARAGVGFTVNGSYTEVGRDVGYTIADVRSPFTFTYTFYGDGTEKTINTSFYSINGGNIQVNGHPGGRSELIVMEVSA
jgi:hypothetical protein